MMKGYFTAILIIIALPTFAQKTEFGVQLNSGMFSFVGESAKKNTDVRYQGNWGEEYLYGHSMGAKKGLNLGAAANIKWISKTNIFLAAELGFDYSKSRINVTHLIAGQELTASGKINKRLSTLYFAPTIGYRFNLNKNIKIDLGVGVDVSLLLHADSKVNITTADKKYQSKREENNAQTEKYQFDLRPHTNLKIAYKKYGIFVGYSHGTTNYLKDMVGGGPWYATSSLWRMGLSYQLK